MRRKRRKEELVFLRPMDRRDVEDFVRWRNSKFVRQNFIYREEFTVETETAWVEDMVIPRKVIQFIITACDGGYPIGCVWFSNIDHIHGKAEYGIFIGQEEYTGKGYGTAAGRLAVKYAFEQMGLNKIYLRCLEGNGRAAGSYKKLGFVQEGYLRQEVWIDGEYHDLIFMGLLKEEWSDACI